MRNAKVLARHAVEEVAGDRLARREADRVHQAVELAPGLAEVGEERIDLLVAADVAVEGQLGAELPGEVGSSVLETLADIGKCKFRAFPLAGPGDAVGDGPVRQQTGDQDFFALQESHGDSRGRFAVAGQAPVLNRQDCRALGRGGQPCVLHARPVIAANAASPLGTIARAPARLDPIS